MTETKDVLGGAVSRRDFSKTAALAGGRVADSGALAAACGGAGTQPQSGGSGGAKRGTVSWASYANLGEAERFKTISPVAVFTACMSINAKPKDQEAARAFLTDYCRAGGQKFPLSGGANAVPALIQLLKA